MVNIVIKSEEANAAATALSLAMLDHRVCLLSSALAPAKHTFDYFGQLSTTLYGLDDLDRTTTRVGIVFGEGEDVHAGISSVIAEHVPELIAVIGGGITAVVDATAAAREFSIDPSTILLVGAFLVGGNASAIRSETQGVLAGFLGHETPAPVLELAATTFPQLSIGDGLTVSLSSVNALFHVPVMILNAMSVERGDDLTFYVEAFGESVGRLLLEIDADRLRLGAALGLELLPIDELNNRYTGVTGAQGQTLSERINGFLPMQSIKVPATFDHRFLAHELRSTFAPMAEIAQQVGVSVPTVNSVLRIGEILLNADLRNDAKAVAQEFLSLLNARSSSPSIFMQ